MTSEFMQGGIESEKKKYYERMIEDILSLPRDTLVSLLVPEEALY